MILKIGLSKAFDRVNWLYLRILLTQLDFPFTFIKWIMSCITNVPYSVLINGSASPFFHAERGLGQGCPLSPLLFLLIMEGLSRIIGEDHRQGRIRGIKITDTAILTHLLFVDDVLIFLNRGIGDLTTLHQAIGTFLKATGMVLNESKSTLTASRCTQNELQFALRRFPFTTQPIEEGLRAGRLILIKAVLEETPVYWMTLAWIPKGILDRLQNICCRFLWKGKQTGRIFAWTRWESLTLPKRWGGRGLKRLDTFSKALTAKLGWQLLNNRSLWTKVVDPKYITPSNPLDWIRHAHRPREDPCVGCGNAHRLPQELKTHLVDQGITHICHIADNGRSSLTQQAWKTGFVLNIPPPWQQDWRDYVTALTEAHIKITKGDDELIWALAKHGSYIPKIGYLALMDPYKSPASEPWWNLIWKLKAAPRMRLLLWSILNNKVSAGRSFSGPFWCYLCKNSNEDIEHLFLDCPISQELWNCFLSTLSIHSRWHGNNIKDAWNNWLKDTTGKERNIPPLIC
eukprot:PITA_29628